MRRIKKIKIIALLAICLFYNSRTGAQTVADTIRQELIAINNTYDSAFFLTFDISMEYVSDTLYAGTDSASSNYSAIGGVYTFHGNKALYKLDNMEYMQNDSFVIALYYEQKIMMLGKTDGLLQAPGSFVPTRQVIDSIMNHLEQEYEYAYEDLDSVTRIRFRALDTNAVYENIQIYYEPVSHQLQKVVYRIKDYGFTGDEEIEDPPADSQTGNFRKATLTFYFSRYRVENVGTDMFNEDKYLFFDGPDVIKPSAAYKDYTLYKNY